MDIGRATAARTRGAGGRAEGGAAGAQRFVLVALSALFSPGDVGENYEDEGADGSEYGWKRGRRDSQPLDGIVRQDRVAGGWQRRNEKHSPASTTPTFTPDPLEDAVLAAPVPKCQVSFRAPLRGAPQDLQETAHRRPRPTRHQQHLGSNSHSPDCLSASQSMFEAQDPPAPYLGRPPSRGSQCTPPSIGPTAPQNATSQSSHRGNPLFLDSILHEAKPEIKRQHP